MGDLAKLDRRRRSDSRSDSRSRSKRSRTYSHSSRSWPRSPHRRRHGSYRSASPRSEEEGGKKSREEQPKSPVTAATMERPGTPPLLQGILHPHRHLVYRMRLRRVFGAPCSGKTETDQLNRIFKEFGPRTKQSGPATTNSPQWSECMHKMEQRDLDGRLENMYESSLGGAHGDGSPSRDGRLFTKLLSLQQSDSNFRQSYAN